MIPQGLHESVVREIVIQTEIASKKSNLINAITCIIDWETRTRPEIQTLRENCVFISGLIEVTVKRYSEINNL